jgi:glucose/mannose-6-phosphate isomerase
MAKNIDSYNMNQFLKEFPDQLEKGLEIARDVRVNGDFYNVVVSGMGGSALPGNLLNDYLGTKMQIMVNKGYTLPQDIKSDTLVLISSYSGNTEESLSVFEEARKRGLKIIGFCSGGKLEEMCMSEGVPFVRYPDEREGFQPRLALGYAFASMCKVLHNCGVINDESENIKRCAESLRNLNLELEAREMAKRLVGRIPVIYTSEEFRSLGYILKIKFNENSKVMSFCNVLPELNHNEINAYVNFKKQGKFHFIILKAEEDHPRVRKRADITGNLIKNRGGELTVIELKKDDLLTKMLSVLYLFDWTSYYLALKYKTNPTPVDMVEELKVELRKE